jgi:predicted DNA binding CopG/RHH family protein
MSKQKIPQFASEDEERAFWAVHETTDYFDYAKAQPTLMPNLRPTLKTVSLRLPESLVESIQVLAHKKDVPYQSLMKMLLTEGVERELALPGESPATG